MTVAAEAAAGTDNDKDLDATTSMWTNSTGSEDGGYRCGLDCGDCERYLENCECGCDSNADLSAS